MGPGIVLGTEDTAVKKKHHVAALTETNSSERREDSKLIKRNYVSNGGKCYGDK